MIQAKNICAGYGRTVVLNQLSFHLPKGENLCILGPNGCGKTTLLRALANLLPYSGEVWLDGEESANIKRKKLARKVALLSQHTSLYFNYKVYDLVMMGRFAHSRRPFLEEPTEEDHQVVVEALAVTGVEALSKRTIDTLSGGQLQRVLLAKILAQNPDIVLLDEPTNHLDLSYQVELLAFWKSWSKQAGKTVVSVLHDLNLALELADTVMLLDHGQIKAYGDCQAVYASSALAQTYKMDVITYMRKQLQFWENLRPQG